MKVQDLPRMRHPLPLLLAPALACLAPLACGPGDIHGPCDEAIDEPWLLAIDEDAEPGTVDALIQVSVEPGSEGEVTVVCDDLELPADFPADTNFSSLTITGQGIFASARRETWGDTLVSIDPCSCTVSEVGAYGYELVSGLASTRWGRIYGVAATEDAIIEIDPLTANAEPWQTLDEDWGSHGLSWTDADQDLLYALNASSDRLHVLRGSDGSSVEVVNLSADFQAVGLEYHRGRDTLYACGLADDGAGLYAIDTNTGAVELVAGSVFTSLCDNLAGPRGPLHCG